jgi:hypothetical protein
MITRILLTWPRPPAALEAELADGLGAGGVAAVLAPPDVAGVAAVLAPPDVVGEVEQPAASPPAASIAIAITAGRWHGPVSQVRLENLRTWLLMSRSLAAAVVRRLRQST